MNIVLEKSDSWYVASASQEMGGGWRVLGVYLSPDGKDSKVGEKVTGLNREEAEKRCKALARVKKQKKGYSECKDWVHRFPESGANWLATEERQWVSPEEMLKLIRMASLERYVYFSDVTGMEEWFSVGDEYLGFVTSINEMMDVYDKFGDLRTVMVSRLEKIESTELKQELPDRWK